MNEFQSFIISLTDQWNVPPVLRQIMTSTDAIAIYKIAFTHSTASEGVNIDTSMLYPRTGNYEAYEQIGDSIIKTFMATYFYRRFPKLWLNNSGVKIVARLMIKYGSKEILAEIAEKYGFWKHIQTIADVTSYQRRASILEDVFEAFIGATSILFDHFYQKIGTGYIASYTILELLFNQIEIPITYDSLFDAKTRLKELVDYYKEKIGQINYNYDREEQTITVSIIQTLNNEQRIIGAAQANLKAKAEQLASEQALTFLKLNGYDKKIQKEYNELV